MRSGSPRRDAVKLIALLGAGIATFASNQSIGVTLPVHVVTQMGGTTADVGLVAAAGTVGVLIGRVASGPMVERTGPVSLGAVSLALVAGTCLGYLLVPDDIAGLAMVRAVHGVVFAWATTALLVAMTTAVRSMSRQRSIALANLAMPISLAVFPVVAIEIFDASLSTVAAVAVVLGLLGAACYLLVRAPGTPAVPPTTSAPPVARRLPMLLLITAALLGAADGAALDYLPVLGVTREIEGYGWAFTVFAVGTTFTLGLITVIRRVIPGARLVAIGGIVTAAALATWPWVDALAPLMVGVTAYGIGFAVAQTGLTSLAVEWSPAQQGKALAGILLAFDIGRGAGVYLIGLLIASSGFVSALVPLALLLAVASIASGRRRERGSVL